MSKNIETNASKAKKQAAKATSLQDLDKVVTPEAKVEAPTPEPQPKRQRLGGLSRTYLQIGIEKLMGMPSPNLTNADFRATLLHWRAVMLQATAANDGSVVNGFVAAVQAVASSEGAVQAKRMIDNVMGQVLWTGVLDITRAETRDSRTAGDVEVAERERIGAFSEEMRQDGNTAPMGLDPSRDPDLEEPPTIDDAREAIEEANQWLGLIADQLPVDDAERAYLGLSDGLPFAQRKTESVLAPGTFVWENVHDLDEAIEIQRDKNKASYAQRTAKTIAARRGTFANIAKLAA